MGADLDDSDIALGPGEISQIAAIQSLLLELPRSRDFATIRKILEDTAALIGASRGFSGIWFDGQLNFVPFDIGPQIEQQILDNFIAIDADGYFVMRDKEYELVNRRRREFGSGIQPDWRIYDLHTKISSPWYKEVFAPAGMGQTIGLNTRLPVGEAIMCFGFDGEDDPAYKSNRTLLILELLLPAFVASFEQLYEGSMNRADVLGLIDFLPYPAALRANDGELHHANAAAGDKDWNVLTSAPGVFVLKGPNLPDLRGTEIVIDLNGEDISLRELARSRGLSERQADVAEQIALGLADKEIARKLDISPNTARRHCEAVLDRLNVNSRSGVLFALLTGRAD